MSITIQKVSGYPQPFINSPEDLRSLLDVDEGLWTVCVAHVHNLCIPTEIISHLDSDKDNLILAKDVKKSVQWCLDRIQSPQWFFDGASHLDILSSKTQQKADDDAYISLHDLPQNLQKTAELFIKTSQEIDIDSKIEANLFFRDVLAKKEQLLKDYTDGLVFLNDIDTSFHADFLLICKVLGKADGLSAKDLQCALGDIDTYTQWEAKKPQTYLACSKETIGNFDALKEDILLFFDVYFREDLEQQKKTLFGIVGKQPIIPSKNIWVSPKKQRNWELFCDSILDTYHKHHAPTSAYLDLHIWQEIEKEVELLRTYLQNKPTSNWGVCDIDRRMSIKEQSEFQKYMDACFVKEAEIQKQLLLVDELQLLFLYHTYLVPLIHVFANFVDFYNPAKTSLIETGSILIDGQYLHLVLQVQDVQQHKKRALFSELFLIYVEIIHNKQKMVCSITKGKRKNWYVGKKGVYIDRFGQRYPIQICDMIENPISIAEELTVPFFTFLEFIKSRFEAWTSGRKVNLEKQIDTLMQGQGSAADTEKQPPNGLEKSWLVHGGLVFAALGSSFAYILQTVTAIPILTLLTILIAPLLLWMLISGIRGGIKIHNRDLAPLLEGNGWSLHHALYIPIWANEIFTKAPKMPIYKKTIEQDKLVDFYTKIDPYFVFKYRLLMVLLLIFVILCYKNQKDILAILDLIH